MPAAVVVVPADVALDAALPRVEPQAIISVDAEVSGTSEFLADTMMGDLLPSVPDPSAPPPRVAPPPDELPPEDAWAADEAAPAAPVDDEPRVEISLPPDETPYFDVPLIELSSERVEQRPSPPPRQPAARPTLAEAAAVELYRPGDVIVGKYKLVRIIGRGGMGAVWLAHNLTLDIDVAIKLIRRDRAAPDAPGRLLQEARAAARLGHPSIVRVFDFGESDDGDPFIVMEVLHGESLSALLARKGRLSPVLAVQMLLPVASALAEAHAKGIVHRDLKPDNILVVEDDSGALIPKVVDFGIAKLLDTNIDRRFTMAGEVLGSPDYMSPEQARGEADTGERTDVWALSVVLYELIAGQRPFDGANYNALIIAIITAPVTPITDHGFGDAALWAILGRGLAKDDAERWPSMRELGAALAGWATTQGADQDVAGTSIAAHWLSSGTRRALSVHPPAATEPSIIRMAPKGLGVDLLAEPAAPAPLPRGLHYDPSTEIETGSRPPWAPSRVPWIVFGLLVTLSAVGFLAWPSIEAAVSTGDVVPGVAVTADALVAPVRAPLPSGTPLVAPSASVRASPTADPADTAKAAATPLVPRTRPKTKAPPVPKDIHF